jgi:hypothetical protein
MFFFMKQVFFIWILFFAGCLQLKAQTNTEKKDSSDYPAFNMSVGGFAALANGICIPCNEKNILNGYSFSLAPGIRINKKFLVEIESHIWINTSEKQSPSNLRMSLLARVNYFPFQKNNFLLQFGIGGGNYFYTPKAAIITSDGHKTLGSVIGTGLSFNTGIAYEFTSGKHFSVLPCLGFYACVPGDLRANEIYTIANRRVSLVADMGILLRFRSNNMLSN